MKFNYLTVITCAVLFTACTSMDPKVEEDTNVHAANPAAPAKDQKTQIEEYVKKNNLKGEFTPSGLYIAIDEPGTGGSPTVNSTVTIDYRGTLLNGTEFDASKPGQPLVYPLYQLVKGWQEGIPKLKKGGKAKLIVPSDLGYGPDGNGPVPPNAVMVFDITLLDFK